MSEALFERFSKIQTLLQYTGVYVIPVQNGRLSQFDTPGRNCLDAALKTLQSAPLRFFYEDLNSEISHEGVRFVVHPRATIFMRGRSY